ncbi:MAG: Helix-turn-helix domain protein [Smithella sp. PtaU1.Bin162]|nr:MAG: Helix-turn-helix domain protein [Smithella sp. PtaU1.Bin162]
MRKRHPNHRLVKIHRSYTVEEIARLFNTHKNTVRRWIKEGLATTDDKRPLLIMGQDLIAFLQMRRTKNKQTCKPEELYCVRCRVPKLPAGNMAEYTPLTDKFGYLTAICPDCHCMMNRRISLIKINQICGKMDVSFPEAAERLTESSNLSVNSDLKKEN